ncbi:MAG TPA: alpha-galactosidase [Acidimicrobiales bacterium]|nr:alpha-galactosidase [Acidimicrobiales bacterium]
MVAEGTSAGTELKWSDDALELGVELDAGGVPRLVRLLPKKLVGLAPGTEERGGDSPDQAPYLGLPLLDVVVAGSGKCWAGRRYSESVVGSRMLYTHHDEEDVGPWHRLQVGLEDPGSGLAATVVYEILRGAGALRSRALVANRGNAPVTLESVTSFLGGGLTGPGGSLEDTDVMWAENDWLAEGRWQSRSLRDALPDLNGRAHEHNSRGRFAVTSTGTWSSGNHLPMGAVVNRRSGYCIAWQVDHNGGWHWQVGEHRDSRGSYLAVLGPTDTEHHWRLTLLPGETFESVPAGVAVSGEGFEGAIAGLTRYRRAIRRPHEDHRRLPVIFNDYMNTLMGNPTTERLLPLIGAAARAGAECFCIDSGWYAEIGEGWWDTVGAWAPSKSRFTNGIGEVLDRIRALGMVPGLWVEPEVVGVRSPVASQLPDGAFFLRKGQRVVEQGRYQLDLRHPAARAHLDKAVDYLVGELGVGYIKMDYNINISPGPEVDGEAPGVGLLAHNRAVLQWVDDLLDRHSELTIENCSSGGMRTDYALLSRCQLLSTSDQQDLLRYPPIAAAAPAATAPEQGAVWAYPQPEWDDDRIAFTLCSAILGRVHLSGFLDGMTEHQLGLVKEAIGVYKAIRADLPVALPFWPLGLPKWTDPWVALGMRSPRATYLTLWRRDLATSGQDKVATAQIALQIGKQSAASEARTLFPTGGADVSWQSATGELLVHLERAPSACLVRIS